MSAEFTEFKVFDPLGLKVEKRCADEYQMHPERLFVWKSTLSAVYVKTDPKKIQTQSTVVVDVCEVEVAQQHVESTEYTNSTAGDRMCWKCEKVVAGAPGISAFCECGGWFE